MTGPAKNNTNNKDNLMNIPKEEYEGLMEKVNAADQMQDKLLRLGAEFENYKKRVRREQEELTKYVGESFMLELLHIIDDFERAFSAADKTQDFKILHQGVEMILKQAQEFLKTKGVKKMEAVGKEFDPHRHEAIEHVLCEDKPENIIVEELQAGYELNGKVIRPARVRVNKRISSTNEPRGEFRNMGG